MQVYETTGPIGTKFGTHVYSSGIGHSITISSPLEISGEGIMEF